VRRKIRTAVSADRQRFKDGQFNLDLTYITRNVIAMAIPAGGWEANWRNHIDDVSKMLTKYHGMDFMIFNLSEKTYTYEKFNNQILEFGFPDHFNPPLNLLFKIIVSMHNWLSAGADHVAVVHCKGGKGRTGTVIASYLTYCGLFDNPFEALDYFAARRSERLLGVTQPSQRRYVRYFGQVLKRREKPVARRYLLKRVRLSNVPNMSRKKQGCRALLEVWNTIEQPARLLYRSGFDLEALPIFEVGRHNDIVWDLLGKRIEVQADTLIKCHHIKLSGKSVLIFRCSLNTAFIDPSRGPVQLPVTDLDGVRSDGDPKYYGDNFVASFHFGADDLADDADRDSAIEADDLQYGAIYEAAFRYLGETNRSIDLSPDVRDLESLFNHVKQRYGIASLDDLNPSDYSSASSHASSSSSSMAASPSSKRLQRSKSSEALNAHRLHSRRDHHGRSKSRSRDRTDGSRLKSPERRQRRKKAAEAAAAASSSSSSSSRDKERRRKRGDGADRTAELRKQGSSSLASDNSLRNTDPFPGISLRVAAEEARAQHSRGAKQSPKARMSSWLPKGLSAFSTDDDDSDDSEADHAASGDDADSMSPSSRRRGAANRKKPVGSWLAAHKSKQIDQRAIRGIEAGFSDEFVEQVIEENEHARKNDDDRSSPSPSSSSSSLTSCSPPSLYATNSDNAIQLTVTSDSGNGVKFSVLPKSQWRASSCCAPPEEAQAASPDKPSFARSRSVPHMQRQAIGKEQVGGDVSDEQIRVEDEQIQVEADEHVEKEEQVHVEEASVNRRAEGAKGLLAPESASTKRRSSSASAWTSAATPTRLESPRNSRRLFSVDSAPVPPGSAGLQKADSPNQIFLSHARRLSTSGSSSMLTSSSDDDINAARVQKALAEEQDKEKRDDDDDDDEVNVSSSSSSSDDYGDEDYGGGGQDLMASVLSGRINDWIQHRDRAKRRSVSLDSVPRRGRRK
jgi:protein-tyrosine phosphatase